MDLAQKVSKLKTANVQMSIVEQILHQKSSDGRSIRLLLASSQIMRHMIQTQNNDWVSAILPALMLVVYILTNEKMNSLDNLWSQVSISIHANTAH